MSQENVEIVRRGYDAYARGGVAAMLADIDAEMVTHGAESNEGGEARPDARERRRHQSPMWLRKYQVATWR